MLTAEQIKEIVTDYFKDKPVKRVFLFGSYAQGEADENSDVDLIIEYNDRGKKLSLFDIIRLKLGLEDRLNKQVDLVEEHLVYHRFLPYILASKRKIYEA